MNGALRPSLLFTPALALFALGAGPAPAADLSPAPQITEPAAIPSGWQFTFTPYLWAPWFSGNATIKGHNFDVQADPADLFGALKFGVMGNLEARKGPFSLMVDGFYGNIGGSSSFFHTGDIPAGAGLSTNAALTIVEVGGSYEVMRWGSGGLKDAAGSYTALDLLAGARIWQQSVDVNLNLFGPAGGRISFAHSGLIDWTDPFVGARIRHELAPGQEVVLRGDIGGFDAGSMFSWQALATYNRHLFDFKGFPVDAYLGFRALSVDYTQGSGLNKYTYDVVQYGPVIGATVHFGDLSASAAEPSNPAGAGGYKDGPASAAAPSWTGYYLGVNGGGGWGDSNTLVFTDTVPGVGNPGSFDRKGGFGGIQAGYNRQGGFGLGDSWVLGLETDFQGSEINNQLFQDCTVLWFDLFRREAGYRLLWNGSRPDWIRDRQHVDLWHGRFRLWQRDYENSARQPRLYEQPSQCRNRNRLCCRRGPGICFRPWLVSQTRISVYRSWRPKLEQRSKQRDCRQNEGR